MHENEYEKWFELSNLPQKLKEMVAPFSDLCAHITKHTLARTEQQTQALRKLIESRSAFQRALSEAGFTPDDPAVDPGEPEPPTEPEAPEAPQAPEEPAGWMKVGSVNAKAGDLVTVRLRGGANQPIMGFAAAIGYEENDLEYAGCTWAPEFGVEDEKAKAFDQAYGRGDAGMGNAGPYIHLTVARIGFDLPITTPPGEAPPDTPGEVLPPVEVNGTLASLSFRVKRSTPKRCPLLLEDNKFGLTKVQVEFMTPSTPENVNPPAITPDPMESGEVNVTGLI